MKKTGTWAIILTICLLLAGCGWSDPIGENAARDNSASVPVQTDTTASETPVSESGSGDQNQSERNKEHRGKSADRGDAESFR